MTHKYTLAHASNDDPSTSARDPSQKIDGNLQFASCNCVASRSPIEESFGASSWTGQNVLKYAQTAERRGKRLAVLTWPRPDQARADLARPSSTKSWHSHCSCKLQTANPS
ncbi:GM17764 [Drosophila sechellia]|uniref:GM17764 n=1 Tax=Drosophila sechellia TaxID=7238 RepID=B4IJD0_DROSE|nr:GM17764 [Drosophila sechellia]